MNETWRSIPGSERHEVSDHGNVRSVGGWWRGAGGPGGGYLQPGRVLKTYSLPSGYRVVSLHYPGNPKTVLVHRLVLEAFVGPCPEGHECCHRDGDATNNHLDNLYWGTHVENMQDRARHGKNHGPNYQKPACKRGHEFTPENTRTYPTGKRGCVTCIRAQGRRKYYERKALERPQEAR